MNAFTVAEAVAILSILTGLLFFVIDAPIRNILKTHWRLLLVLTCLALFWRWPFHKAFFHGLEYEDAYVYTVAARTPVPARISEQVGSAYLASTCAVGSIDRCQEFETYSGHYIGWPAIIRIAIALFGYSPELSLYLNIAGSCASVVLIFLVGFMAMGDPVVATAAAFVYASTPVFAVNGIATYAEPMSNTYITAVLLLALRCLSKTHSPVYCLIVNSLALTGTLLLAVLVKRENALLAIGLLLCTFTMYLKAQIPLRDALRSKLLCLACICVIVIVFCVAELRLGTTVLSETREFGGFPFGLQNCRALLSPFLAACFSFKWYAGTFILVLIGTVQAVRERSIAIIALCFLIGYLLLYLFHVHGYYQVHGGRVLPYDTLRFAMNMMTLYSLLAGLGLAAVCRIFSPHSVKRAGIALVVFLAYTGLSYSSTLAMRQHAHDEEYAIRINPARAALEAAQQFARQPLYIVTLEPLLVQTYGSTQVNVIALYALNQDLIARLRRESSKINMLFVDQSQYADRIAQMRYASALRCLDQFPQEPVLVGEHYVLKRLVTDP